MSAGPLISLNMSLVKYENTFECVSSFILIDYENNGVSSHLGTAIAVAIAQ